MWRATLSPKLIAHYYQPVMSILIAEDNVAQRHYLREILEKEFPSHVPVFEAGDGEETVKLALERQTGRLHSRHPDAEALRRESRARHLARLPDRANHLLDAVSA